MPGDELITYLPKKKSTIRNKGLFMHFFFLNCKKKKNTEENEKKI